MNEEELCGWRVGRQRAQATASGQLRHTGYRVWIASFWWFCSHTSANPFATSRKKTRALQIHPTIVGAIRPRSSSPSFHHHKHARTFGFSETGYSLFAAQSNRSVRSVSPWPKWLSFTRAHTLHPSSALYGILSASCSPPSRSLHRIGAEPSSVKARNSI